MTDNAPLSLDTSACHLPTSSVTSLNDAGRLSDSSTLLSPFAGDCPLFAISGCTLSLVAGSSSLSTILNCLLSAILFHLLSLIVGGDFLSAISGGGFLSSIFSAGS